MALQRHILYRIATVAAVAILVISCKEKSSEQGLNLNETPLQTMNDMFAVQTRNGVVVMRLEADLMQHFETDTLSWDLFPEGFTVYSYTDEGLLEALVTADKAKHTMGKGRNRDKEVWAAIGNVVVHNVLNRQTMETDTIYWDRAKGEIYTDCYVRMSSPDGFMQGYGMRSDDRARNSILLRPFNGYAVTVRDTTTVVIDSVNFIGPLAKK